MKRCASWTPASTDVRVGLSVYLSVCLHQGGRARAMLIDNGIGMMMCMCVCIRVYIYYTCVCLHVYVCIHTYIYIHLYIYIVNMRKCIIHTDIAQHEARCEYVLKNLNICVYVYVCIHLYIYIYTHLYRSSRLASAGMRLCLSVCLSVSHCICLSVCLSVGLNEWFTFRNVYVNTNAYHLDRHTCITHTHMNESRHTSSEH